MRWRFWRRWGDCPRASAAAEVARIEATEQLRAAREHRPVVEALVAHVGRLRQSAR